jgi:hypothetical protein
MVQEGGGVCATGVILTGCTSGCGPSWSLPLCPRNLQEQPLLTSAAMYWTMHGATEHMTRGTDAATARTATDAITVCSSPGGILVATKVRCYPEGLAIYTKVKSRCITAVVKCRSEQLPACLPACLP